MLCRMQLDDTHVETGLRRAQEFRLGADAVEAALADIISLEEGLQRVADALAIRPNSLRAAQSI